MRIEEARRLYAQIDRSKETHVNDWKQISRYIAPTMGQFDEPRRSEDKTSIDYKVLINSAAVHALKVLGSGMMSGLTSPSVPWFKFKVINSSGEDVAGSDIEKWADKLTAIIEDVFAKSNLYDVLPLFYNELAAFGSAAFFVEEDFKTIIRCTFFTAGSYSVALDNNGRVNRFCRRFMKDVMGMAEAFGLENCPESVKAEYANKQFSMEHEISHIIVPNVNYNPNKRNNLEMRYASVYFCGNTILRESGYRNFPVVFTRWKTKTENDVFGTGIGHEVLGDVRTLQKMEQKKLIAVDKLIDPPLQINGSETGSINLYPGGVTRGQGGMRIDPIYNVGLDLTALQAAIDGVERRINEHFFVDVFQMIASRQDKTMTAYEVSALLGEKMMILGPIYHMIKTEGLDPLMSLVIEAGFELNFLPPPPDNAEVSAMDVEYISTIAMAQKAEKLKILQQGLNWGFSVAQAQRTIMQTPAGDNIDMDGLVRSGMYSLGLPADTIRSKEEIQQIRAERAAQQQAVAQAHAEQQNLASMKVLGGIKNKDGSNGLEKAQEMGAGRF